MFNQKIKCIWLTFQIKNLASKHNTFDFSLLQYSSKNNKKLIHYYQIDYTYNHLLSNLVKFLTYRHILFSIEVINRVTFEVDCIYVKTKISIKMTRFVVKPVIKGGQYLTFWHWIFHIHHICPSARVEMQQNCEIKTLLLCDSAK